MVIRESCRVMMVMRSMIMLVMVMMMGENEEAIQYTYIGTYVHEYEQHDDIFRIFILKNDRD